MNTILKFIWISASIFTAIYFLLVFFMSLGSISTIEAQGFTALLFLVMTGNIAQNIWRLAHAKTTQTEKQQ